jgi:hypothetical protein
MHNEHSAATMAQNENRFHRYLQWLSGAPKVPTNTTALGGFPYLIRDGTVASAYNQLVTEIEGLQASAEVKEITKLAVASHYKARGEIVWLSRQIEVLSTSQVLSIVNGVKPANLTREGGVTYDAVMYLIATPGLLPRQYWENCFDALGKDGTIGIIHLVGLHIGAAVISNAVNASVPNREKLLVIKK